MPPRGDGGEFPFDYDEGSFQGDSGVGAECPRMA